MKNRLKSLETILVLVAGLLALFFWLKHPWLLHVALLLALAAVFSPWLAEKVHTGWMLLARGIAWFNSRVLLTLVFYGLLTPIAWLAKRVGSSHFDLKKKKPGESYYTDRNHKYKPEDLEQPW